MGIERFKVNYMALPDWVCDVMKNDAESELYVKLGE